MFNNLLEKTFQFLFNDETQNNNNIRMSQKTNVQRTATRSFFYSYLPLDTTVTITFFILHDFRFLKKLIP